MGAFGERKILDRYVDGFCEETNTVYQFHGCFYHGCETCFDRSSYNMVNNETFFTLRERTRKFTRQLMAAGYNVVEKWECECNEEKRFSQFELKEKRDEFFNFLPLNPRDALYGGRTSTFCLTYDKLNPDEKIKYYDFTSLYPFVQKKTIFL